MRDRGRRDRSRRDSSTSSSYRSRDYHYKAKRDRSRNSSPSDCDMRTGDSSSSYNRIDHDNLQYKSNHDIIALDNSDTQVADIDKGSE